MLTAVSTALAQAAEVVEKTPQTWPWIPIGVVVFLFVIGIIAYTFWNPTDYDDKDGY